MVVQGSKSEQQQVIATEAATTTTEVKIFNGFIQIINLFLVSDYIYRNTCNICCEENSSISVNVISHCSLQGKSIGFKEALT